jgi:hypothetical protein
VRETTTTTMSISVPLAEKTGVGDVMTDKAGYAYGGRAPAVESMLPYGTR